MAGANRFVDLAAPAIFGWLTHAESSPERQLIEWLLAADPTAPLALERMSYDLKQSVADIGRWLFALNRQQALLIDVAPPEIQPCRDLPSGLQADLSALANHGTALVLANKDGLLIAYAASTPGVAERVAAGMGKADHYHLLARLFYYREQIAIHVAGPVNQTHPAWVSLARRLWHAGNALSFRSEQQP